jgi:hypothetical protein
VTLARKLVVASGRTSFATYYVAKEVRPKPEHPPGAQHAG